MKKKIISTILTAILLMSQIGAFAKDYSDYPQKFWDVPKGHWAFEYISELVDKGVISGYEDGSFRPDNTVTRAEWAKIMVLAAGLPVSDNSVYFRDMDGHWANVYINTAKDYLAAYTDGTFKPNQAAVREDVTVSMVKLKGYDISNVDYSYLNHFSDTSSISNSLKVYVAIAIEKELINGFEDGTFRGQDTLTRAEAATLLWRAFQYGSDNKVVDTSEAAATPDPTSTPTSAPPREPEEMKPTEEPKATPEPEPTKPYKVDILAKANLGNDGHLYTADSDYLYYAEDSKIIKVDIESKDREEILDTKDLTIDNDEYTLDDFDIISICYDKYKDSLVIQGEYRTINSAKEINSSYLYELKGNGVAVITNDFSSQKPIVGILSNGDYITTGTVQACGLYGSLVAEEEVGDRLYDLCTVFGDIVINPYPVGYQLVEYDYVDETQKWSYYSANISYCLSDRNFVIMDKPDNDITFYNFNGKELNKITETDIAVADKTALNFSNAAERLLITDNDDIIFYDKSAKTFRIISKND